VLNTPGYQDGAFRLEVNGRLVLDLSDVFYRDAQNDPGLLGPLLGDLLGGHNLEDDGSQVRASAARKGSSESGVIDPSAVSADPKKSVEHRRADRHADVVAREDGEPIGFKGIFFRFVLSVFTTQSGPG
jgi:hypothetical protein